MSEEQQQEQQQQTTDADREALIAAVREAGGTESVDVAAEAAAAEAPKPAPAAEQAPTAEDPDEKLASVLRAREAAHKKRLEAEEYAAELRRAAEEEKQRIIEEARAEAERQREAVRLSVKQQFQADPTGFLKNLDDDPQNVVDAVVKQGTPEWRALQEARAAQARAEEAAKEGKSAKEALEKFKAEQAREKREQLIAATRAQFLSEFASPEKAPYMHARWEPEEVFERCDSLCREWQRDGLKLGVDFDRDTLVAYLEKQSRERVTKVVPQVSTTPVKAPDTATKSANGSRTLLAAQGSERRTSPKPLHEMSPEEQRAALIAEVAAARRANPDAQS